MRVYHYNCFHIYQPDIGHGMRSFSAIRSIATGNPSTRNDYLHCIVYMVKRDLGMRFHFRHISVVQEWNDECDINNINRTRIFMNKQDRNDPFVVFARSS